MGLPGRGLFSRRPHSRRLRAPVRGAVLLGVGWLAGPVSGSSAAWCFPAAPSIGLIGSLGEGRSALPATTRIRPSLPPRGFVWDRSRSRVSRPVRPDSGGTGGARWRPGYDTAGRESGTALGVTKPASGARAVAHPPGACHHAASWTDRWLLNLRSADEVRCRSIELAIAECRIGKASTGSIRSRRSPGGSEGV